jgi:hypothetical protein
VESAAVTNAELRRVIEILEAEAECLHGSYTDMDSGEWGDRDEECRDAHQRYDEILELVGKMKDHVRDLEARDYDGPMP